MHRNHSMGGLVYKFAKKAVRVLAVVSRFRFQKFCLFLFRLDGWSCQFTQHIKTYLPWSVFTWECIFRRLVYTWQGWNPWLLNLYLNDLDWECLLQCTCHEKHIKYLGIMCILLWGKYSLCYSCLLQQEKLVRVCV